MKLTANDAYDLNREKEYQEKLQNSPSMYRMYEIDYAGASVGIVKANPENVVKRAIDLCQISHFLPQKFDSAKINYSDKNGWKYMHMM